MMKMMIFTLLKKIDNLNNKTMAYMDRKFKDLKFLKSKPFKDKTLFKNYNKGGSSRQTEGANKGGYKYGLVNM